MPSLLRHAATSLFAFCSLAAVGPAQDTAAAPAVQLTGGVAATPPLGWNGRGSYGSAITEAQFRANVDVLHDKLQPFGWQYAILDRGWFVENPRNPRESNDPQTSPHRPTPGEPIYAVDANGRYVPVVSRFPSAGDRHDRVQAASTGPGMQAAIENTSFAPLAAWVHARGLQFGIGVVRGIPRASVERNLPIANSAFHAGDAADTAVDTTDVFPGDPADFAVKDNAAGQAWYDSLLEQYAGWGVDFLTVDCIASNPYPLSEIEQIRRAITKSGRPMVLRLAPGPTPLARAGEIAALANVWSLSGDVGDVWGPAPGQTTGPLQSVLGQFPLLAAWAPYARPPGWPDAGTLPLGKLTPVPGGGTPRSTRLTPAEQQAAVTLWAMARSPLLLGTDLTLLDAPTTGLLTNRDVLRINQTAVRSALVLQEGKFLAWRADLPGGEKAIAIFNLGATDSTPTVELSTFGTDLAHRDWSVREVWSGGAAISGHEFLERIAAHGAVLLLVH